MDLAVASTLAVLTVLSLFAWWWRRPRARVEPPPAPPPAPADPPRAEPTKPESLLDEVRRRARIPFESPTRGAVCLARLGYDLPKSESVIQDATDRALAIIARTIRHPHEHASGIDQFGNGHWFELSRHVTEDGRRWDFIVDVKVDPKGAMAITDVKVTRPVDRDDEESDEPREPPTSPDATAPLGVVACPCCGRATLSERSQYAICPVCFWEDDGQDDTDADLERGGPNTVSLTQARKNFVAFGACDERCKEHVRKPTAEEVELVAYDADGRRST
ncbi:MAG: hypothetical protein KF819_11965 [Labilithrix sp.]|nr:hypothetical protein [Labilithrix sp.]